MLCTNRGTCPPLLSAPWTYENLSVASVGSIFLGLLQRASRKNQDSHGLLLKELTNDSGDSEELSPSVSSRTQYVFFQEDDLMKENSLDTTEVPSAVLVPYRQDSLTTNTMSTERSKGIANAFTDTSFTINGDPVLDSQLQPRERYVHRSSSNVADILQAPLFNSGTAAYSQGNVSVANQSPNLCKLIPQFQNKETLRASENILPVTGSTENHYGVSTSRSKPHLLQSCPDLYIGDRGRNYSQNGDQLDISLADWSPLGPQQPAILEGIDESAVYRLPLKKPASLIALTSSRPRPRGERRQTPGTETSHVVSRELRPNIIRLNSSPAAKSDDISLFQIDTEISHPSPSSAAANVVIMQNSPSDVGSRELRETFWNQQSDIRRNSLSDLLIEPAFGHVANDAKCDIHEHVELSSLSPSQRKRKFHRRRSASLPKRVQSRHGKVGKTKKLCKKKNDDNDSKDKSCLLQAMPRSTYGAVSSVRKPGTHTETANKPPRGRSQLYASLLCTGLQTSWKDCITNDGSRAPLVVLYEPDVEPSSSDCFLPDYYGARARGDFDFADDGCIHIRRRSSVDKVRNVVVDGGEFTVIPVRNETCLDKQPTLATSRTDNSNNLRVPLQALDIDGEPSDTLTQNSITSLLSLKFRDVAKRWKQYGLDSPRFRKRLHSKWESMNYEEFDSQLQRAHNQENKSKVQHALNRLSSWLIYFFIGVGTAFMAAGVQITVEIIAQLKFTLIRDFLDKCNNQDCLFQPVAIWISLNAGITVLGAVLVTYVQPMAAGSGIPLIKSYLNGVRIPGLLSLRAFVAKCLGVILSILGGLACGKEGPMAHSGGIVAAGLGKGRIPWFNKDISLYSLFRTDHNIRDLVAAGAASGVSAAFGAPVGGTLFSVEEAASFWNTELVWKVFFAAMIACFSTNVLLSAFEGHPTQLSNPGLVRFNTFPNLTFDLIEVPVFIFMAAIGGLVGSLFVVMNYKLTIFRQKYLHRKRWIKVVEAVLVAVVGAIVAFILMVSVKDCTSAHPYTHHAITSKIGCTGETHNSLSTLFLTTPEGCLKALLHDPIESYSVLSLVLFVVIFFLLGVWTYGLSVSSGVFIPSLAIGAAWGRLIGLAVVNLFPDQV